MNILENVFILTKQIKTSQARAFITFVHPAEKIVQKPVIFNKKLQKYLFPSSKMISMRKGSLHEIILSELK